MKRLILTRHAKSSWDDPELADEDRPLNARGEKAAPRVGEWLAEKGHRPDEVLHSTARRCRQTWELMAPALPAPTDVRAVEFLYLAQESEMLDVLKTASGDCVLMIGHMPGIGGLARRLRRDPPPLHDLFTKYPTGATTVLDFPVDEWTQARFGDGIFVDYTRSRDLG